MSDPDTRVFDGTTYYSADVLALLCGITVEEVRAETQRQAHGREGQAQMRLPAAWLRGAQANQRRLRTDDLPTLLTLLRFERDLAGR